MDLLTFAAVPSGLVVLLFLLSSTMESLISLPFDGSSFYGSLLGAGFSGETELRSLVCFFCAYFSFAYSAALPM